MSDSSAGSQDRLFVRVDDDDDEGGDQHEDEETRSFRDKDEKQSGLPARREELVMELVQAAVEEALVEHATRMEQSSLEVVFFFANGAQEFKELSRGEIYQLARASIPGVTRSKPLRDKRSLAAESEGTLRYRDMRLLDTRYANAQDPTVAVRRHSLLVVMPPLRCLVLHDQVLVVVPEGGLSALAAFVKRLRSKDARRNQRGSFTLKALEAVFRTSVDLLQEQLSSIVPRVASVLSAVQAVSSVSLTVLREVSAELARLISRIESVQGVYDELLASDSDMALMNLNKVQKDPLRYVNANQDQWEDDHNEVELLLESYSQSVDGVYAQAKQLEVEIESGVSVLMIQLDTARNNLLRVDLLVSCITSAAAIGALVAGIFGMNLKSEIEDNTQAFWSVAGSLFAFTVAAVVLSFSFIRRKGWINV